MSSRTIRSVSGGISFGAPRDRADELAIDARERQVADLDEDVGRAAARQRRSGSGRRPRATGRLRGDFRAGALSQQHQRLILYTPGARSYERTRLPGLASSPPSTRLAQPAGAPGAASAAAAPARPAPSRYSTAAARRSAVRSWTRASYSRAPADFLAINCFQLARIGRLAAEDPRESSCRARFPTGAPYVGSDRGGAFPRADARHVGLERARLDDEMTSLRVAKSPPVTALD